MGIQQILISIIKFQPNIIAYTLFEQYDKKVQTNGYLELVDAAIQILDQSQDYACLRIDERKFMTLQVLGMLNAKYNKTRNN